MRQLLRGAVDMHIHSGPAVIRRLHSLDVARELREAGYAGFVVKDHHFPTAALAWLVTEAAGADGFTAYGSIVLNSSVGGVNVRAVDAACAAGARMIFLPTISAPRHIELQGDFFASASATKLPEKPVRVAESGRLTAETEEVLEYLTRRPDVVLATGHSAADELDLVIRRAVELGVERVLVNHPVHTIGATWEQMEAWSRLDGVYLEVNAVDMEGMSKSARFPMRLVEEYFKRLPVEKTVVTSDFGQIGNGSPVEGMLRFIAALRGFGISDDGIVGMIRGRPAQLLR